MSVERPNYLAMPGMREAIDEIEGSIRAAHPGASFEVAHGEDPDGLYVSAVVETDDLDTVVDLFVDRLVDLQVESGLPLYVVPIRPAEHVSIDPWHGATTQADDNRPNRTIGLTFAGD